MTHLGLSSVELSKRWEVAIGMERGGRHESRYLLHATALQLMFQMPVSSFLWENGGKGRCYLFHFLCLESLKSSYGLPGLTNPLTPEFLPTPKTHPDRSRIF